MINKKIFLIIILPFVLAGCQAVSLNSGLKFLDENLGRVFNNFQGGNNSVLDVFNKKTATTTAAESLTSEQKKKIDAWLEEKGLNRYGDAKNAVYTGGTPLFDEKTGQPIERYAYILNKFPDILKEIK